MSKRYTVNLNIGATPLIESKELYEYLSDIHSALETLALSLRSPRVIFTSAAYTLISEESILVLDTSSGTKTVSLALPSQFTGNEVVIKSLGANPVTITAPAGYFIDLALSSITISSGQSVKLIVTDTGYIKL